MPSVKSFWDKLPRPIMALAPMADVTDAAFRRLIAKCGPPDITWTEFVSADGLCHPLGRERLRRDLLYTEAERPIVAQLFGARPEQMKEAAQLIAELGFDGLDLNMGCPDRAVEKQGAGAALMKNPKLARELIRAAREGTRAAGRELPISVKTRLGYNKDELETWLPELLAEAPAAVTIHARTRKEMSKVPARWERVRRAVEIRNELGSSALILGNGDATDLADARVKAEVSGADGVMLGRAIFGNPWLFAKVPERDSASEGLTVADRLVVLIEHAHLFEELLGGHKSFAVMKKHFKAYIKDFEGAAELRAQLMETENAAEVETIIQGFLTSSTVSARL
jgi:nifR3 family TIM-barrel protein